MQDLIFSYTFRMETKTRSGAVPGGMTEQQAFFLDQDESNTLPDGRSIKINTTLNGNQSRTIDLRDQGIHQLRSLLIKVLGTSSPTVVKPLQIRATLEGEVIRARTIFFDFDEPTALPVVQRQNPYTLVIENPNSAAITITLIAIGY